MLPEWLRLPLLSCFEAAGGGGTGVPEAEAAVEAGRKPLPLPPLCPHALLDSVLETVRLELDPDSLEMDLEG